MIQSGVQGANKQPMDGSRVCEVIISTYIPLKGKKSIRTLCNYTSHIKPFVICCQVIDFFSTTSGRLGMVSVSSEKSFSILTFMFRTPFNQPVKLTITDPGITMKREKFKPGSSLECSSRDLLQ